MKLKFEILHVFCATSNDKYFHPFSESLTDTLRKSVIILVKLEYIIPNTDL